MGVWCIVFDIGGILFDFFYEFLKNAPSFYYTIPWLWFHYIVDRDNESGFTR